MKFLFDLFPVILFFTSFRYSEKHPGTAAALLERVIGTVPESMAPILLATIVVMLATIAQISWVWLRKGKISKILWISLALVLFFGGLTLIFQDDRFIKWKPSILYWVLASTMLFSSVVLKKNAIQSMMEEEISLPDRLWRNIDRLWIGFFVLMGLANLAVAFFNPLCSGPDDCRSQWVNFKLISMGFSFVVVLIQVFMMYPYLEEKK